MEWLFLPLVLQFDHIRVKSVDGCDNLSELVAIEFPATIDICKRFVVGDRAILNVDNYAFAGELIHDAVPPQVVLDCQKCFR